MSDAIVKKFVVSMIVVIVAGFAGWLIQVAFPWVFQNATGGYPSEAHKTIVNNLPIIFVALALVVVVVYLLYAAMSASGSKR